MLLALTKAVTLLGSVPFVLPVSGVITAVLWRRHSVLAAAGWLAALAAMVAVVVVLKIAGHACNFHLFDDRLTSPSGHAALSAAVYGAAGVLAVRHLDGWRRNLFLLAVFGAVAGVAASRVLLRHHSVSEVLAGLALGGLAVVVFVQGWKRFAQTRLAEVPLDLSPLVAAAVILFGVVTVTLGNRPHVEPMLKHFAALLREEAVLCGPPPPLYTVRMP